MNELVGTGALVRLILRRDWLALVIWSVIAALVPIGVAASFAELYPTAEALQAVADESMSNPAVLGMLGPLFSATIGGLVAWRTAVQSALLIGIPSLVLVIRHTRSEEEAGRRELLGSTVVGRQAGLAAALIVVLAVNLGIAALTAAGLIGLGLPAAGSMALGLSAAAAGWVFAALGALAAQLTHSSGSARGISLVVFGLSYLLRLAGDVGGEQGALSWLSWLSPLGWMRLTRPYADEQWWVFMLLVGTAAALAAAAFALSARRDLGAGLLPPRLGPASASPALRSPLALAWRLQRGGLLAWTATFAVLGVAMGGLGQSLSRYLDTPVLKDWASQMTAQDVGEAFLFIILYVLGQVVSAYAITATLRMRSEEVEGRAEPVLAGPVSRLRWASSHLIFATIGPAVVLAALGFTIGLGFGLGAGDVGHELPRLLIRALWIVPAVWVMAGLAAALYGLLPRFAAAGSWAALVGLLLLELAWELRQVSQSVFNFSPFAHVHWTNDVTLMPQVWLAGVAAALTAAGLVGFRRRDLG